VPTYSGAVYVCVIIDAFSQMIVGWRATTSMRAVMVLDALKKPAGHAARRSWGWCVHSDAGSQGEFTSIWYGDWLAELGAVHRIGRGQLRQRSGRSDQQPVQDGADPPVRLVARRR
jgi:putative transposase